MGRQSVWPVRDRRGTRQISPLPISLGSEPRESDLEPIRITPSFLHCRLHAFI